MSDEARVQLAAALDDALPQTQCKQCGYAACRPYAEAISRGEAGINQCPPGGDEGARRLASLAGVAYEPVDARFGITKPPAVAVIDEAVCIGCTLCIVACPVDAIVGATKRMHTVIAAACTGCELCLPPCPVDCIRMIETAAAPPEQRRAAADLSRVRFNRRSARLARAPEQRRDRAATAVRQVDRDVVQAAITRARERLARRGK